ncbi:hypothetical protein N7541_003644 [Penicillium brevicompactum]|uniref:Uncharacterized protein n=1 Tax=Penicillium brevicompactum TaxID=5074 RepID=A0A9W9V198_PENBR|nr:hypothetical protein N7541_003644 [Penicillium brevicompactum]
MKASTLPRWPRASASASMTSSALAGPDNPRHDSTTSTRKPTSSQSDPPSTPATQPVLVRAYSGNVDPPTMSSRRFFPFSSSRTTQPEIPLPSDKDFSIESILQAIEPDIRGTLDSIAEICGRSKLSLANEYGSHIAPLGEITAPAGLMPVEEGQERIDVLDEENIETGLDMHPFSFHRYLENLRHTASMMENGTGPRPGSPRSPGMNSDAETVFAIGAVPAASTPLVREFASRPNHTGSQLLAKNAGAARKSNMATAAVVSEVHLDASADGGEPDLLPKAALASDGSASDYHRTELVHQLLGWLNLTARVAGSDAESSSPSAEDRLRAMLRVDNEDPTVAATS